MSGDKDLCKKCGSNLLRTAWERKRRLCMDCIIKE